MRSDAFFNAHPAVSFGFFLAVMLITAFVLQPVITGVSLAAACAYSIFLKGRKGILFCLFGVLPLIFVLALINPLFNHAGVRVLFYLWNGNAVTLEAVLYGIVSACMFASLILWCSCLNQVMSSDKYVYLFGRLAPVLSLLFSMVLRFVPRFLVRIRLVGEAQSGLSGGEKGIRGNIKRGLSIVSATVTWALESSVTMADSMKSRGYGLKGRTMFSLYTFRSRDAFLTIVMLLAFAVSVYAVASGHISFRFYPSIKYSGTDAVSIAGTAAFTVLTALPLLLNLKEKTAWRKALSGI